MGLVCSWIEINQIFKSSKFFNRLKDTNNMIDTFSFYVTIKYLSQTQIFQSLYSWRKYPTPERVLQHVSYNSVSLSYQCLNPDTISWAINVNQDTNS